MLLILLSTLALLLAGFILQIVCFRLGGTRKAYLVSVALFFLLGVVGIAFVTARIFEQALPLILIAHFMACYGFLSLSYLSFFSLIIGESPSTRIAMITHERGDEGLPIEECVADMLREDVVGVRVNELERDGLIQRKAGKIELTQTGRRTAHVFRTGRRILGLCEGG